MPCIYASDLSPVLRFGQLRHPNWLVYSVPTMEGLDIYVVYRLPCHRFLSFDSFCAPKLAIQPRRLQLLSTKTLTLSLLQSKTIFAVWTFRSTMQPLSCSHRLLQPLRPCHYPPSSQLAQPLCRQPVLPIPPLAPLRPCRLVLSSELLWAAPWSCA